MSDIQTDYADLLNRLYEMRQAPYYAAAKGTLHRAEAVILGLESENRKLKAQLLIKENT